MVVLAIDEQDVQRIAERIAHPVSAEKAKELLDQYRPWILSQLSIVAEDILWDMLVEQDLRPHGGGSGGIG